MCSSSRFKFRLGWMPALLVILVIAELIYNHRKFAAQFDKKKCPTTSSHTAPCLPEKATINVLCRTRSYRDGPLAGSYSTNTNELIFVEVTYKNDNGGKWAMYGGGGKKCHIQRIQKKASKAAFTCAEEGTYVALYMPTDTLDPIFNDTETKELFQKYKEVSNYTVVSKASVLDTLSTDYYENEILGNGSNVFYYSDPFTVVYNAFCYRWGYRFDEVNAVGVIHTHENPHGSFGSFRLFEVKVWIMEPGGSLLSEIYWDKTELSQSSYSTLITRRFKELGITPCIREAHSALEVISDPEFGTSEGLDEFNNKATAYHWTFQIKLYRDRMVTYLSDVTFTIRSRQLSGLYGCFIADVRVFLRAKYLVFLQSSKFKKEIIHIENSNFPAVMNRIVTNYTTHFLGNKVHFDGYPWDLGDDKTIARKYATIFPNACVMQEFVLAFGEEASVTEDGLFTQELNRIILPGILEEEMLIDLDHQKNRTEKSNREITENAKTNPFYVTDFALIPSHLVVLRADSILMLHPSDLDLKGIGVNYGTQKFRLGALVRRKWCASSATPKVENQLVPGFSRLGNFIIVYAVPIESHLALSDLPPQLECEEVVDSSKSGSREKGTEALTEWDIHSGDPKVGIEAHVKHKTRADEAREAKEAAQQKPKQVKVLKEEEELDYWYFGDYLIPKFDKHFAQGATDPKNVRSNFTSKEFNRNVIFVVEKNFKHFESSLRINAGIRFREPQVIKTTTTYKTPDRIKQAESYQLMAMHAVEFSAVEKRFIAAIEFQSPEFPRASDRDRAIQAAAASGTAPTTTSTTTSTTAFPNDNDLTIVIAQYDLFDLSLELPHSDAKLSELELENVRLPFSGCVLYRKDFAESRNTSAAYDLQPKDFYYEGTNINIPKEPFPLQKRTVKLRTINTAFPFYVMTMGNVIIFGTTNCAFARPLTFFEKTNPQPKQFNVRPTSVLEGSDYDFVATRDGVASVLFNHNQSNAEDEQKVLIGSLLANEPLRLIRIFMEGETHFQTTTPDGEILYGRTRTVNHTLAPIPATRFLEVPFWSLLRGSILLSLGYNKFPLKEENLNPSELIDPNEEPAVYKNDICPFSSFSVLYKKRNFAEAGYRIRITAEVAYHGASIPLDADLLVEFNEIQGVSVLINAVMEVENDLTQIRKTIDIETFLTETSITQILEKHLEWHDDEPYTDFVRVFTITIRPSILNLNCEKDTYFKTIQLNIGCVFNSKFRLLAENLPLKKVNLTDSERESVDEGLAATNWTWYKQLNIITAPRDRINFKQRKLFQCENDTAAYCTIPFADKIDGNFYDLSYRDSLVPIFEHYLTSHVRRFTGNLIMYDLLESWKEEATRLVVNTTQWNARCIVDDGDWYSQLASEASNSSNFSNPDRINIHADIYQFYNNCFSRKPSARSKSRAELPILRAPELNQKKFWVFNHTNYNAISINRTGRPPRNFIYIIRAVVLNTEYNSFTYCQVLDTYFALKVDRVTPQREPLSWYIYLGIILSVLLVTAISYIYFCRTYSWRTDLETDKPRLIEEHKERLRQKALTEHHKENIFMRVARRAKVLTHWKAMYLNQKEEDKTTTKPAVKPIKKPEESSKPKDSISSVATLPVSRSTAGTKNVRSSDTPAKGKKKT